MYRPTVGVQAEQVPSAMIRISCRRTLLERAYAGLSRGDLEAFCTIFEPEVVVIDPWLGNPVGWAAVVAVQQPLLSAFPGMEYEVEEILEEAARTVCRLKATGLHTGWLGNVPTTGRLVHLAVCDVHEWSRNRVVTFQRYADKLTLLHQVGALLPIG